MSNVYVPSAIPRNLQWWGIGREVAATTPYVPSPGTITAPTISIPTDNAEPTDQVNMLLDKAVRGDMGEDYNDVLGVTIGAFPLAGDVYLGSIGHILYNLMGEYTATGASAGGLSGTVSEAVTVGESGAVTVVMTGTAEGSAPYYFQVNAGSQTSPTSAPEIIVCSAASATSVTVTAPGFRFSHASGATITQVVAPFVHTFKLLNSGGATAFGAPANAQPPTHTITHYNGLSGSTGQRQYGYWCASAVDFTMDVNNLFQHQSRGTSLLGADNNGTAATNSQDPTPPIANWQFAVGIGGPASGSTLIQNVEQASVSPVRTLVPKYGLAGQQAPLLIGRLGLSCTGRLTFIGTTSGTDMETGDQPLTTYLAGTEQALQISMTNGLTGSSELGIAFNFQRAKFEASPIGDQDMMSWDVSFRALMNNAPVDSEAQLSTGTTGDAGYSGGRAPFSVALTNNIPTY